MSADLASAAVPEVGDGTTYSFRPSLMGAPQEFALAGDGLHWSLGTREGRVPYRAIRRVRLSYRPLSMQMYRFVMEVWAEGSPKLTISSSSWRSMVEQQRQDAPYNAFVRELHRRLLEAGAEPTLVTGSPALVYWPGAVLYACMAVALSYMLVRTGRGDAVWGGLIVAAIVVTFLWQLGLFFWRNRPGTYELDAVPASALPRGYSLIRKNGNRFSEKDHANR